MLRKIISNLGDIGKLQFSYQEKTEFVKDLEAQRAGNRKLFNVLSDKLNGGLEVALAVGDMTTATNVDAWVIPEFDYRVSEGGVAKRVLERAAESGNESVVLEARENYRQIVEKGTNYGYAHISSGFKNGGPKAFIHVVTAEVPSDVASDMISEAVYNALMTADEAGLESIAFPALNTGVAGSFSSPYESAEAMYAGIQRFIAAKDGQQVLKKILIVAFQSSTEEGKLLSKNDMLRISKAKKTTDEKIAIKAYGPECHYAFIEALYVRFGNMLRSQGTLSPELSVAKKVVFDMLETVGGVYFSILDEEEANQLKSEITSKLLQAIGANKELALSKDFLRDFIGSISEMKIDKQEFERVLAESITKYIDELDTQISKLGDAVEKISNTIDRQVEVINANSPKKVAADSPKFGKLNDQMHRAIEFKNDCEKLKICVERINRKVVDEQVVRELQLKYEDAVRRLQEQEATSKDAITDLKTKLKDMKKAFDTMENKLEQEKIRQKNSQASQPVYSPSYRTSG